MTEKEINTLKDIHDPNIYIEPEKNVYICQGAEETVEVLANVLNIKRREVKNNSHAIKHKTNQTDIELRIEFLKIVNELVNADIKYLEWQKACGFERANFDKVETIDTVNDKIKRIKRILEE